MTVAPPTAGTILSVAPSGARAQSEVPHLPVAPEEVASAAADCERVGAAVLDLEPRSDAALADVVAAARARTGMLVRITARERAATVQELIAAGPDALACPLDSSEQFRAELCSAAAELGTAVHYEARQLVELDSLPADAPHVTLVFDTGSMPGDVRTFTDALGRLPGGTRLTAAGLGPVGVPVALTALAAGGHVRVGMADTAEYAPDVPVRDNAQLVARVAGVAKIAQRPPLPAAGAREVLGLG